MLQPAKTKLRGWLARKVVALAIPLRYGAVGQAGPAVGSRAVVTALPSLDGEDVLNCRPINWTKQVLKGGGNRC